MSHVVVVTGAGASHDSASDWVSPDSPALKPPLTKDLFSDDWKATLTRYPLVRQAAADIRQALRSGGDDAVALEDFLRERMQASTSLYTMRRFRQVPLYLQDVLSQASAFTREPDNYNALVNAALELDEVLFLTLNYDTLLDGRLAEYWPLTPDVRWYVEADTRWSLIKLHGSVNWGWRLPLLEKHSTLSRGGAEEFPIIVDDHVIEGLPTFDIDQIEVRTTGLLPSQRWDTSDEAAVYYPALAIPLGPEDELVCPSVHVEAARQALDRMDGLNLLVIGYSGLDREVLGLLLESGNSIRSLLVVNGSGNAGPAVERIAAALGEKNIRDDWQSSHDFSRLVRTGDLRRWMSEVAGDS